MTAIVHAMMNKKMSLMAKCPAVLYYLYRHRDSKTVKKERLLYEMLA